MIGDPVRGATRHRPGPGGAPPWMTTFADLATLLLSFFVLLLSFSELDVERYKQIAGSMREAFGVKRVDFATDTPRGTSAVVREFSPGRPDPSKIMPSDENTGDIPQQYLEVIREGVPMPDDDDSLSDGTPMSLQGESEELSDPESEEASEQLPEQSSERSSAAERELREAVERSSEAEREARENIERIRALLRDEIERGLVEVERQGSRVIIRIRERGSFPSGSAELIEPFTPVIRKIGQALQMADGKIVIAGHTDDVPISTRRFRSNWDLSSARAVTLLHRLRELTPVDQNRITVEGHADTRPLTDNDSVLERARNRRVEVILVHGQTVERAQSLEELLVEEPDALARPDDAGARAREPKGATDG